MYICVTHVDAKTGIPCTEAPMRRGPAMPNVKGLKVRCADYSQWPTETPNFYGICDDDADVSTAGVIKVLSQQEYKSLVKAEIKERRDKVIEAGTTVNGINIATDDVSQQRITGAALAATVDPSTTVRWKLPDDSFVTLDAAQVIAIAQAVRTHIQACFDREAELLEALNSGQSYDLNAGWP
jgi:hypothetical protein